MKTIISYLLISMCCLTAGAQAPSIAWQKALGGTGFDAANAVIQCTDSTFLVVSTSGSSDGDVIQNKGNYDILLVKFSQAGSIIWQKSFGGTQSDYATAVQQTKDGGFVVAGYTRSGDGDVTGNHGQMDAWILKLSATGSLQWQKALGGSAFDAALSVKQTFDGGYIVAGWSGSSDGDLTTNNGDEDSWVIKLTPTGAISWQHSLGGSDEDHATAITQTSDSGYIVVGATASNDFDITGNHGKEDFLLYKLSPTGALVWQKCLGGGGNDVSGSHGYPGSVHQTTDGGYILSGWSDSSSGDVTGNHGNYDAWVVKVNDTGGITWQTSLGGSDDDESNYVLPLPDGGYMIAGTSASVDGQVTPGHGGYDFWLAKLSSTGSLVWEQSYGGDGYEVAYGIQRTFSGNYIVVGFTNLSSDQVTGAHGDFDGWVVYLEDPAGISETGAKHEIAIWPNPTGDRVNISGLETGRSIRVFNGVGQVVKQASNTSFVSIKDLPQGIYFLWVYNAEGVVLKKEKLLKL